VGTELVIVLLLGVLVAAYSRRLRAAQSTAEANLVRALDSERVFSESFHASPIPLALVNLATHRLTEVNGAFERLIGATDRELLGQSMTDLGIADEKQMAMLERRVRRNGHVRNFATMVRSKHEPRSVVLALDQILVGGEPHGLVTFVDDTDQKRALAALQSSDQRMRELTENIDEVFWVATPERDRMLYISPAYEKIWGRPCARVLEDGRAWLEAVLPEDRARLVSEKPHYDFRIERPDGSMRWIRTKIFPVRSERGDIIRVAGVSSDITEQRTLEEQLRHAQKMESLGMLAGGIAHDFNNLLAVISSCSGLLAESLDRTNPDRELVEDIADAVVRATAMTRQLLAFSRKQVTEPVVLDPNVVVNDTRKLLRRMVGVNIELVTSLEPELRPVLMDRGHLVQVILNLAVNARDAMPTSGRLCLTTRNVGADVVLEVSDTGSGMAPDVLARACEPFFTTKEQGKGTGMGLAVVHGIIDGASGRLDITSAIGVGTTFRITLPAFEGPAQGVRKTSEHATRGIENILIVDDDDYVRRATARALRSRGYSVVEAGNGRAALIALTTAPFDLLLTDIVMPGMSGRVLAEAACARFPELKIMFMTGYTDDAIVHDGVTTGVVDLIEKPFTIPALAAKVRQVLDAGDGSAVDDTAVGMVPVAAKEFAAAAPPG
jgi:two-component system, cell cycle sensor histidine kinase and response regulator CckA